MYPTQNHKKGEFYLYFDGQTRSKMPTEDDLIINNGGYMSVDHAKLIH